MPTSFPAADFRGRNLSVRNMIQMATMVEDSQMIGVPSWTNTARYDVDGKTVSTEPVTQERKSDVMMALLEERFSFKVHRDTKQGPVYRLEIAKGGPRLVVHGTSDRLMSTNAKRDHNHDESRQDIDAELSHQPASPTRQDR
jgi:uncharacterized protein (TIGR03435 family)